MMSIAERLKEFGIELPPAAAPIANYVPAIITGNLLIVSGQLCLGPQGVLLAQHTGKIGRNVSPDEGRLAAYLCGLNILAQAERELGSLDRIVRCIRLGGFINATPEFSALPQVMNGASDLMVAVFGDKGRHARTTIGVASLPLDACVEVEAMFEIAP
jgi:enamine deaminase RidA (YjgF/YER057c/UK114 family)